MMNVHSDGMRLLSRTEFRESVLARHDGLCCVPDCAERSVDAHHILERRLWTSAHESGGYLLANGAAVCGHHHYEAEQTVLDPDDLRVWSGIDVAVMPEQFYLDQELRYTKWGDIERPDGSRLPGPLFWDESVQKVLGRLVERYDLRVKYPRTLHLPWSPGRSDDDKVHSGVDQWDGVEVVVTEKMDGECATIYPDGYMHARSTTASPHPSRDRLRADLQQWAYSIPHGWRVVGENLTAVHSIAYTDLPGIFMVHSIWDRSTCLSWDDTVEWCELLDVLHVPVLWRGTDGTEKAWSTAWNSKNSEGYVVRPAASYALNDFQQVVGKYVRAEHVTSDRHWRSKPMTANDIAG